MYDAREEFPSLGYPLDWREHYPLCRKVYGGNLPLPCILYIVVTPAKGIPHSPHSQVVIQECMMSKVDNAMLGCENAAMICGSSGFRCGSRVGRVKRAPPKVDRNRIGGARCALPTLQLFAFRT